MSVAGSVIQFLPYLKMSNARTILDYGAGTLRNSIFLTKEGFRVIASDWAAQLERVKDQEKNGTSLHYIAAEDLKNVNVSVDAVLSTFVFNVILDARSRMEYIQNIRNVLKPGGYFLVEVRRTEFSRCVLDGIFEKYGFLSMLSYYGRYSIGVLYLNSE